MGLRRLYRLDAADYQRWLASVPHKPLAPVETENDRLRQRVKDLERIVAKAAK